MAKTLFFFILFLFCFSFFSTNKQNQKRNKHTHNITRRQSERTRVLLIFNIQELVGSSEMGGGEQEKIVFDSGITFCRSPFK